MHAPVTRGPAMRRLLAHGRTVAVAALATSLALVGVAAPLPAQSELIAVEPLRDLGDVGGAVRAVAVDLRGETAAVGAASGRVTLARLATGEVVGRWQLAGEVTALAFLRDGGEVAAVTSRGDVHLLSGADGSTRRLGRGDAAHAVAASPRGTVLAVGGRGGEITLWSVPTAQVLGRLRGGHRKAVRSLTFLEDDGASLLSVGEDRQIVHWDVKQMQPLRQTAAVDGELTAAATDPAARLLAVGGETFSRGSSTTFEAPGRVGGSVFSGGNAYRDVVRVYDARTMTPQKLLDMQGRLPAALSVSPDYRYLAVASRDVRGSSLGVWDLERGVSVVDLPVDGRIGVVAFAPTGRHLVTGGDRGATAYAVRGVVPRTAVVADLRGVKYRITSPQTPLVRPTRRLRVAVVDFDDNGVGADVSRAIADQIDNRLAANPAVRLVERRRIATILQEQGFQHGGRTDPGTAVQLARVLNVTKVVLGSVARLGTTLTIAVRLVDVETAAIDGVREVQCQACSMEDLSFAVAELAQTLVSPAPALAELPDPPVITIEHPVGQSTVQGGTVTIRGTVAYSRPLEALELVVNGRAVDASRLLEARTGRATRLADGLQSVTFVQDVPLAEGSNLIAVRALGGDGNDEQRYVSLVRAGGASAPAAAPGIALAELESALRNGVPAARLVALLGRFGVDFTPDAAALARLRASGASAAVVEASARARRVPAAAGA